MRVRVIQWFNDRAIGYGTGFRPKDVVDVPDEAVARRWIQEGRVVSIEPEQPAPSISQKVKKAFTSKI